MWEFVYMLEGRSIRHAVRIREGCDINGYITASQHCKLIFAVMVSRYFHKAVGSKLAALVDSFYNVVLHN